MQYVTIDRGNRFRGSNKESTEDRNRFTNKAESNINTPSRFGDEEETAVTDAPQTVTSTGRNLE